MIRASVVSVLALMAGCGGLESEAQRPPPVVPTPPAEARFGFVAGARPAPELSAEAAAERHVRERASGFSPGALATLRHRATHDHGARGVVVSFTQQLDGIEVEGTETRVLLRADHGVVSVAWGLRADVSTSARVPPAELGAVDVVARALADMTGVHASGGGLRALGLKPDGWVHVDGEVAGLRFRDANRARRLIVPTTAGLVPAWRVEVMAHVPGEAPDARLYLVDARDGAILRQTSLRHAAAHDYRVWVEPTGEPMFSPTAEDLSPHPTGLPGFQPHVVPADVHTLDGFNTAPGGGADPWLPAGQTGFNGNNARGYVDRDGVDGLSPGDLDPISDPSGAFLADYDFLGEADANNQAVAALTSAFYVINWMHDWYYDSGFTERAGAHQALNYGRGGAEGDPVLVETADFALVGNAYAFTFDDGRSPVLSFGLGGAPSGRAVVAPDGADPSLSVVAEFSPPAFDVAGDLTAPLDATGSPLGCAPFTANLSQQIVVLDRGVCPFEDKVLHAEAAGALAVIVANDVDASLFAMRGSTGAITSPPTVLVSREQGAELRALASLPGARVQLRTGARQDWAMDGGVVAHEWGHAMHWRLNEVWDGYSWGPSVFEGVADFVSIHQTTREGDAPRGPVPIGWSAIYAPVSGSLLGDALFGVRRYPYSADRAVNGLSFRHIRDGEILPATPDQRSSLPNSSRNNAGEVVASALFEGWLALVATTTQPGATRTFHDVKRAMTDYLVLGLQTAPPYMTFTELRDGVIAAAAASNPDDARLLGHAFASRGLGTCAVSPAWDDLTFQGVVEDGAFRPAPVVAALTLRDDVASCDDDGILDPGERGTVEVVVQNASLRPMRGAVLRLSASTPALRLQDTEVVVPDVASLGEITLSVPVTLIPGGRPKEPGAITATVEHPDACAAGEAVLEHATHADVVYRTTDTFEATELTDWTVLDWSVAGPGRDPVWASMGPIGEVITPPLHVGAAGLTFAYRHRYDQPMSFGTPAGGGSLFVTEDEGARWYDVRDFADPGYNGTYGANPAYVGRSPAWPDWETVELDLGHRFDGQTVYFSFVSDLTATLARPVWEIDALAVTGLLDAPFGGYTAHAAPDSDGDAVCDAVDLCAGDDSGGDADLDGVCDFALRLDGRRAGEMTGFTAVNAPAGTNVVFLVSTNLRGGPVCHPTLAGCTSLGGPLVVLGSVPAAGPRTTLSRRLPMNLVDRELRAEAVAVDGAVGVASGEVRVRVSR